MENKVISKENSEHYTWGDSCDGWHLVKTDALSVIQERVPPGSAEVLHYHESSEQFFFVLSGEATLEIIGIKHKLCVQQWLHVPAGVPHRLSNEGANDLSFIVTSTPPSHGDRIEC